MADLEEINERHEKPIRNKIGLLDKILMVGIILGGALRTVPLVSTKIKEPTKVQRYYEQQSRLNRLISTRTELSEERYINKYIPSEVRQKTLMIIDPAIEDSRKELEELKSSEEFRLYQEQVDAQNRRYDKYWFSGIALTFGIPIIISMCGIYDSRRERRKIKENQAHQGEV